METCDRISYHISYLFINVFERFLTCDLTFSPSGDENLHDILRGGLRSSHMLEEGLSLISHVTAGTYV
jgi:hypothetical protein